MPTGHDSHLHERRGDGDDNQFEMPGPTRSMINLQGPRALQFHLFTLFPA